MGKPDRAEAIGEIARVFLRLGFVGFGGPIAMMAMIEEDACRKRKWVSTEHYGEVYAILKLFPGPLATQMVLYLGWLRAGVLGGVVAGALFTLPAFLIMLVFSVFYAEVSKVPALTSALSGMQAAALAVILISAAQLAKPYKHQPPAYVIGILSAALVSVAPSWEPLAILVAGVFGVIVARRASQLGAFFAFPIFTISPSAAVAALGTPEIGKLFWVCLKAGALVFGSGLAIVPLLEAEVVTRNAWLTHAQFMDGLAIGQATPGPVVKTATFIGYQVAGFTGACVATFGIFAPAFFNVLVILPRILKRVTNREAMQAFASWAIPAVVGGIVGTTLKLGWLTLVSPVEAAVFVGALAASLLLQASAWLVIPLSGMIAWAAYQV
jgi:chromate transporter